MPEVLFVQPPYGAIERPAIGLGLLHAVLEATEISSGVRYLNLDFAEMIGPDLYYAISVSPNEELVGEWTFSQAAFRGNTDAQAYFDLVEDSFMHVGFNLFRLHRAAVDLREVLLGVSEQARGFVDQAAEKILGERPRIVGCSSTFQQHTASLAILRRIKELEPAVFTILGGGNCEGEMGVATHRHFPWVDVVVSGEGEALIHPLCRGLLDRGLALKPRELPFGVIGPQPVSLAGAPPRALVSELDRLPIPQYAGYYEKVRESPLARYVQPGILIETSRGCWWGEKHHCTFCGLNGFGMGFRAKSPQRVVAEFRELARRHGLRTFEAVDNILSLGFFDQVLPALAKEQPGYEVFFEVKANLKRAQLQQLADAGVRWLQPGLESLHDQALAAIDKGTTALQNVQYLRWALELGINTQWIFLFDVPGEREEWYAEMAALVSLIEHLQPPAGFTKLQYHRFSPYQKQPERWGLKLEPCRSYAHVYPLSKGELGRLAYFFEDYEDAQRLRQFPTDESALPQGLQALRAAVKSWRKRWYGPPRVASRPTLERRHDGEALVFRDTRLCAPAREVRLAGLERRCYEACEQPRSAESVVQALSREGDGAAPGAVEAALAHLVHAGLVARVGGRHLALAFAEPCRPLAGAMPSGHVHVVQYRRDHADTGVYA